MLRSGQVQLWWATPYAFTNESLAALGRFLPADERSAAARFVFESDRKQALLTRVMVRHVLAHVEGGLGPDEWRFCRTPFGRPIVANPDLDWLTFSLSHTRTLVVCAVAAHTDLGVDIESLARPAPLDVADRFFSSGEAADILLAPIELRSRRFLEYWTLKEAFIKALGLGLALPLDSFSFRLRPNAITVSFSPERPAAGAPERWQFHLGDLSPAHVLAVACSAAAPLDVTFHAATPLLRAAGFL